MEVYLLNFTPEPLKTVYTAARTCYSDKGPSQIWQENTSAQAQEKLLTRLIKAGHLSVLEHISFTFSIEGVSRVTTHQIVRHRLASYSQQSQRYVRFDKEKIDFIIPDSIEKRDDLKDDYTAKMKEVIDFYNFLLEKGIQEEDARFIFPQSITTNIVITMNARELLHFFRLRCCSRSQWEIREVAYKMLEEVKKVAPVIFQQAGPVCESGECPEVESCARKKA